MSVVTTLSSTLGMQAQHNKAVSQTMMSESPLASRPALLSLLARAETAELAGPLARLWPKLSVRDLRAPEVGLVMLRGRIGGDGAPFNVGEATMTRAVVEISGGDRGFGQVLGRKPELARMAAIVDAVAQRSADRQLVESEIIAPIRQRLAEAKSKQASETAATKVDFFTLVRGED